MLNETREASSSPAEGRAPRFPCLRRGRGASLEEVHRSVALPSRAHWLRRMLAFSGPAYLVSVGYMDPGNWATDLVGGARFGYALLWVLLLSNLMALLLQTLSARLGVVTGQDLAQACRDAYPPRIRFILFGLCEVAIAACDLAEVLGTAIGVNLLTGVPLLWAVVITGLDVFFLLAIQRFGIRKLEALILTLITTVGGCFLVELFLARPSPAGIARGLVPTSAIGDPDMLFIATGILGATVMPHNLYLHSALVQSRDVPRTRAGIRQANKYNLIDSVVALNGAFLVNAAILIVSAAVFFRHDRGDVSEIQDAHRLLEDLLGTRVAPVAFAIALICAGQSSTITGTLAGQITMEGFLHLRVRPWLRRLLTRSMAIAPAVVTIAIAGEHATTRLLVLSQVILSLQLPFAVVPLVKFTASREKMGELASPRILAVGAWAVAALIIALNAKLVWDNIIAWSDAAGSMRWLVLGATVPPALGLLALLGWMTFRLESPAAPSPRRAASAAPPPSETPSVAPA